MSSSRCRHFNRGSKRRKQQQKLQRAAAITVAVRSGCAGACGGAADDGGGRSSSNREQAVAVAPGMLPRPLVLAIEVDSRRGAAGWPIHYMGTSSRVHHCSCNGPWLLAIELADSCHPKEALRHQHVNRLSGTYCRGRS